MNAASAPTNVERRKTPIATNKLPVDYLFLLPDPEVNIRLRWHGVFVREDKAALVAIALVLSVHVDKHRQALCNVAIGG